MTNALPSLPLEAGATKLCTGCGNDLPRSSFYARPCGKLRSRCKLCLTTANAARLRERYANDPARRAHADRVNREREARIIAKEYRETQREALSRLRAYEGVPEGHKRCSKCAGVVPLNGFPTTSKGKARAWCKPCQYEAVRECKRRKRWAPGSLAQGAPATPEHRLEIAERINHLTALLMGTATNERIETERGWDAVGDELRKLWNQGGEKACVACERTVPPEAMHPPGPANFYTGKCHACAHAEWEGNRRRTYGPAFGPLRGSRLIPMRDGTAITVAVLAERVRARQAHRRAK